MNKIIKNSFLVLIVCIFVNGSAFSEAASTKLTDSDVKNFCKNFETIEASLVKYQLNMGNFGANLSKKQKTEVEAILNKNGISGPNAIGKVSMIGKCYMLHSMESVFLLNPGMAAYMKMTGIDFFSESEKEINSVDYAVVLRNISVLDEIFADGEFGTTYPFYD